MFSINKNCSNLEIKMILQKTKQRGGGLRWSSRRGTIGLRASIRISRAWRRGRFRPWGDSFPAKRDRSPGCGRIRRPGSPEKGRGRAGAGSGYGGRLAGLLRASAIGRHRSHAQPSTTTSGISRFWSQRWSGCFLRLRVLQTSRKNFRRQTTTYAWTLDHVSLSFFFIIVTWIDIFRNSNIKEAGIPLTLTFVSSAFKVKILV